MQIKSIKKQSNGKYKLKLDNDSTIVTYDSVILNNNLLFNKNIDSNKINTINKENNYYDIYNTVLKLVSKKVRSEKEINEYLNKYELDEKNKKKLMEQFKKDGLINDHNFLKAYIHDRMMFSNDGPFKIKDSLLNLGIDNELIELEFNNIDNNLFDDKKSKIILKMIKNNIKYSNSILKRKIYNELNYLGYDTTNIEIYFNNLDNTNNLGKIYSKLYNKYKLKYSEEELKNILFQKLYSKGFSKEEIWNFIKKDNF